MDKRCSESIASLRKALFLQMHLADVDVAPSKAALVVIDGWVRVREFLEDRHSLLRKFQPVGCAAQRCDVGEAEGQLLLAKGVSRVRVRELLEDRQGLFIRL